MAVEDNELETAADWIRSAQAMIVTAGAGMGVDSGLPDFRGPEGFWSAYPALKTQGMCFYDIASPHHFEQDTARLAWGFYGHRLAMYRDVVPHAGFGILHKWASRMSQGAWVFTSNVDGHFQRGGFAAERVHECHGSIHRLQCARPCCEATWPADAFQPVVDADTCLLLNELPVCPACGGATRPNILMFDDPSWIDGPSAASWERLDAWRRAAKDVLVIEIGAGTDIPTVRRFGERVAGRFLRINPRQWRVRGGPRSLGIEGTALHVLRQIDRLVGGE
ncbi:NAD-dependent protein deacetylase [Cupriavidus laharis]|uniref:protein acetyllysine N-acetyltransferase n=1 Tax=Cupriavidus laharis TaxID=151654 RepID=A0ABM8WYG0_9BURK|nr:Sir2 family NAD-dependent protein deacetylase [Cupriavidus laharis]CAG9172512.1 NAD-dependent protein deacetylase [Cupriavidus laharis]